MCPDTFIGAEFTKEKTKVIVEDTVDDIHSSSFEYSDGIPVRFLPTLPLSDVRLVILKFTE